MPTPCVTARDIGVVPTHRGSPYDPSARPLEGKYPWRVVGKMGIDATIKSRHDPADFERAWPRNWGKVKLQDYLWLTRGQGASQGQLAWRELTLRPWPPCGLSMKEDLMYAVGRTSPQYRVEAVPLLPI